MTSLRPLLWCASDRVATQQFSLYVTRIQVTFLIVLFEGGLCFAIWALAVAIMVYHREHCLQVIPVVIVLRCWWVVASSFTISWMCANIGGRLVHLVGFAVVLAGFAQGLTANNVPLILVWFSSLYHHQCKE